MRAILPLKITPTEEQLHILDLHETTKDNLLITALAGTGKTTMLELIIEQERERTLYLVFNKRNQVEACRRIEAKIADGWPMAPVKVQTLNAFGYGVWGKTIPYALSMDMDKNGNVVKTQNILRTIIGELKTGQKEVWDQFTIITDAVSRAKNFGYIPEGKFPTGRHLISAEAFYTKLEEAPSELACDLIDQVLTWSIKAAYKGNVDFDDQVYMPALFGGTFPRFPLVLIDEKQDLSPVNHEMLSYLSASRLVGVGDDAQSIYQFRGAKQGGMAAFKERHAATEATLSVCFRCPRAIVENARWRVPNLQWVKEGGHVEVLQTATAGDFRDGSVILCRNNAPLIAIAFRLLSSGRSVVLGGSDIATRVINQMKKLGPEEMNRETVLGAIEDWRAEKLAKASTTANDFADCMRVFAEHGRDLSEAIGYAEYIFSQHSGTITLLTGHKAKGLEWKDVYHLNPQLIGHGEQEDNLRYVIQTRSMENYYEINSDRINWG